MATAEAEGSQSQEKSLYHNLCSTCNEPSKYRCPKCLTLSCSLNCVKAHKEKSGCDGIRDKTAFVPLEEFKDRHLHSDYHFLEDVIRSLDNAQRLKRNFGFMHFLPPNLFRLQSVAKRRKTELRILPVAFARRKASTTYLRYSDGKIFWKLEWVFPLCDLTYSDARVDEEQLLGECLDKYLLIDSEEDFGEKLDYYRALGHKGVSVLIKDERTPANVTRFLELNQNKSLRQNFKGKKIIEFPTLLVVPVIHLSCYLD
ncbi:hypothetical protein TNIN_186821 [Trichonephila inaurata madagascariensis]|uniref:Box C/D snoRNA protein 1 n=1 Tax=Trichonephila inaurata madagascariensis TaxID=2747483 RepID=A0A8X7BMR2_9ARAC|nr:hypothetical protein TNIN_186821 [Trichonephila inaurata madagascariensis]